MHRRFFITAAALLVGWTTAMGGTPFLETPIPDTCLAKGDSLELNMLEYFIDIEDGDELGLLDWSAKPAHMVSLFARGQNRLVVKASSSKPGDVLVMVRTIDTEQLIAADSFVVSIVAPGVRATCPAVPRGKRMSIRPMSKRSIRFTFGAEKVTSFSIFDGRGRIVDRPAIGPGAFVDWNARELGVGVYFAVAGTGHHVSSRKFILR